MSKTVRSSQDITLKAGAGSGGSHRITLDAKDVRIPGNLSVDGTQTTINSTTLTLEDQFMEVNRNNSTAGTEDSGIFFNQGSSNNQIFFFDADQNEFVIGQTTHGSTVNTISNITPGQIKIATTPAQGDHAASKSYVDAQVSGGGFSIGFRGDDSAVVAVTSGNSVHIAGATNLSTAATEADTVTITLDSDLTNITSITSDSSNGNLTLKANGTGDIVVNDTLTFSNAASTPTASAVTKLYNKTAGGGGTGLYFNNSNISSGTEGELISKSKATALAIALG
tara:strand:- start:4782 stop:5624 length:843 start_codon:yes stop_codon:yes gene_type:complete